MIIFALLSACSLLCFAYPYLLYPLTLRWLPSRPLRLDPHAPQPSATALFAAYNEERALSAKIENLRAIRTLRPDIELIAYSDGSTDRTLELLQTQADGLTVIVGEGRIGKATGMRRMVAMARGEICIFTDANVILDPQSIGPLLAYFSDPAIGGVAGTLHYVNARVSNTARVGGIYWRLEERLKRAESRSGSVVSADGSIFAVRRSLYPEVPAHLLDDMTVSVSLIVAGKRLIHADEVVAYEKNVTSSIEEFRRKRRIACRAFNTHRHLWPAIRRSYGASDLYKYISHKMLRWFGLAFLLLAIGFGATAAILAHQGPAFLAAAAVAGVACLLGFLGVPLLSILSEALLMIVATFLGIVDALRGRTYQTWTPAASRD